MSDQIPDSQPVNPYAPPKASIAPGGADVPENAEQIRRELLKHEASVRSIGSLYLLGAVFGALGTVVMLVLGLAQLSDEGGPIMVAGGAFYGLMTWISVYLGRGLRRLDAKVRTGTTILAVIGLLAIPLGTLINIYILYLLHSQKGKRVMTPEYQAIIARTPHIKYRTPVWLILLVVLIVAVVVISLVAMVAS